MFREATKEDLTAAIALPNKRLQTLPGILVKVANDGQMKAPPFGVHDAHELQMTFQRFAPRSTHMMSRQLLTLYKRMIAQRTNPVNSIMCEECVK